MQKLLENKLVFMLVARIAPLVLTALGSYVATNYYEGFQAFCGAV